MSGELVDYEMGIHVFGGTSSPGFFDCAFKRTGMDNAQNYDIEVVETLLHNFYVDDPLLSVESEEIAIQLIKDIRKMCGEGGFNLTKFICNRRVVLPSVPECHQRIRVKNADLGRSLLGYM